MLHFSWIIFHYYPTSFYGSERHFINEKYQAHRINNQNFISMSDCRSFAPQKSCTGTTHRHSRNISISSISSSISVLSTFEFARPRKTRFSRMIGSSRGCWRAGSSSRWKRKFTTGGKSAVARNGFSR